jgi:uncharacterized protein (TIGR03000 family)
VTKRTILAATLTLLCGGAGAATADFFRSPWDMSLGPYYAAPPYSYNVAYGYGLPFGSYQLFNPFDPYQNPGRGAYYARDSFYPLPYGQELYTGPRFLFRDRSYVAPNGAEVILPVLQPVPAAADGTVVTVEVNVPANAEVWFDGEKTAQTGPGRVFHSPPLRPGIKYMYLVRAKWSDGGRESEQMQTITVQPGEHIRVSFPTVRP